MNENLFSHSCSCSVLPRDQQTHPFSTQPCWIAALHEPLTLADLNSFREEEEEEVERPYLETPGQGGGGAD